MRHAFLMVLFTLLMGCPAGDVVVDDPVEGVPVTDEGTEGEAVEAEPVVNEAEPTDETAKEAVEGEVEVADESGEEIAETNETNEGGE